MDNDDETPRRVRRGWRCCGYNSNTAVQVPETKAFTVSGTQQDTATSNALIVGVIDQESQNAAAVIIDTVTPPMGFDELLAKIASRTQRPTRRLFLENGTEMRTVTELVGHARQAHDQAATKNHRHDVGKHMITVVMEVIATDGTDFRYKYGDHASYRFGDLIVRPMYQRLVGAKTPRDVKHPPQPPALLATGNLKDIMPDFFTSLFKLCDRYGPLVKLRVFDSVIYICQDADVVNSINELPDKRIPPDVYGEKGLASYGVFIADGQQWEFGRRCLQACLTPESIDTFVGTYSDKAFEFLDASKAGHGCALDVFDWAEKLTMDVICKIGFGHEPKMLQRGANDKDAVVRVFDECLEASFHAAYTGGVDVMGIQRSYFAAKMQELNKLLDDIIDAAEASAASKDTILSHLLVATCPVSGRGFTRTEMRDQLMTLLVAGHKTSSMLLTWSLYHVASQPAVEEKLVAELRSVFGNDMERPPSPQDLRKLKYMDLTIRETLRLNSPVQTVQRSIVQPVKCGEYTLLPGGHSGRGKSYCAVHVMGISRSKRYWGEDALEFRPERFEPQNMANFHPFQYIPFGGGKRLCIGNLFAITQVKTVLSISLRRFYLRLTMDKPVRVDPRDFAAPLPAERGGGVWLQFTKRVKWDGPVPELTRVAAAVPDVAEVDESFDAHGRELLVLWAGEFGTTKKVALSVWEAARKFNFKATLKTCGEVSMQELSSQQTVVICCATYNSHPPPNAASFVQALQEQVVKQDPALNCSKLEYAVLACGNSNWVSSFAKIGKDIDKALEQCGARRLFPVEIADKNDDFERQSAAWRNHVFAKLGLAVSAGTMAEVRVEAPGSFLSLDGDASIEATPDVLATAQGNRMEWARQLGYHMGAIQLRVELCKQPLPESDNLRSVKQLRISLPAGLAYKAGDHLEVVPCNPMELVERMCARLKVNYGAVVTPRSSRSVEDGDPREMLAQGKDATVWAILGLYVDLQAVPSQKALVAFADVAQNEAEKRDIMKLVDVKNQELYIEWSKRKPSFVDALESWPSVQLTLVRLVEIAPANQPRLYSIASSPKAVPLSVELCCGIVKYKVGDTRICHGLCSNWLDRAPEIACKVKPCPHMYLPEDHATPIMCVCGGTGIAPFLGFLQERAAQRQAGEKVGKVRLYFGCRAEYDFLHAYQLRRWESDGVCDLSVSFSRKRDVAKEYVYHALRRDADIVQVLLAPGSTGRFYLCGSASTLAKDCVHVLAEILGKGDLEEGHSKMHELQDSGRISLDVWG